MSSDVCDHCFNIYHREDHFEGQWSMSEQRTVSRQWEHSTDETQHVKLVI